MLKSRWPRFSVLPSATPQRSCVRGLSVQLGWGGVRQQASLREASLPSSLLQSPEIHYAEDPPDTLVRGFLTVGGAEGAKTPTARKPLGPGYPPKGFRRFQVVECPFFTWLLLSPLLSLSFSCLVSSRRKKTYGTRVVVPSHLPKSLTDGIFRIPSGSQSGDNQQKLRHCLRIQFHTLVVILEVVNWKLGFRRDVASFEISLCCSHVPMEYMYKCAPAGTVCVFWHK